MKLKRGVPMHSQISQWLRQKIDDGTFLPDQKLPSENEMAQQFDVSRVTIRRALQSLESESMIYRCQGLGSFVSDPRASHQLVRLTDFHEDMKQAGLSASTTLIRFQTVETPEWILPTLQLEPNSRVVQIDRLRLGDGQAIAFDSTWLPMMYGQLLDPNVLESKTIYHVLEEQYEIPILRGTYIISADAASSTVAHHLNVEPGSPLLLMDRTSCTLGEKPVYFQRRYYRSDRVAYELVLERDPGEADGDMPFKEFNPVFRSGRTGS
ncbi:MAG: GntR family transcriptional regulator [Balneolaceae bacterium]